MKLWCAAVNSSQQKKSLKQKTIQSNDSSSSSVSYATILSMPIPKYDSGFSETTLSIQTLSYLEQILILERTHYENLNEYIGKYSRPLRRYLNPNEIIDLFQNIEKISAISQSVVRQCEKFLDEDYTFHLPISIVYQSWFGVMVDSYKTYISRCVRVQATLKQYCHKIAYFLRIPVEIAIKEIREFILLPIQHICMLNDLFQSFMTQYLDIMNSIDWNIIQTIRVFSKQTNNILQLLTNDQRPIVDDMTIKLNISPTVVLQRTNNESWEPKELELVDSKLLFIQICRVTSICLSNIIHIEEDHLNEELCLIVASTMSNNSHYSSFKMIRVYVRFPDTRHYCIWLKCLRNAIKKAKDQNWTLKNELVI